MLTDSTIDQMALDILDAMNPESQQTIEEATPEERKFYQEWFASYVSASSGEPYEELYLAVGKVIEEIAEKGEASIQ
jgi:thiaminase